MCLAMYVYATDKILIIIMVIMITIILVIIIIIKLSFLERLNKNNLAQKPVTEICLVITHFEQIG